MTRRTRTAMRHDGCTPIEAERIRFERERLSRYVCWWVFWFLLASFAPHVWRAI